MSRLLQANCNTKIFLFVRLKVRSEVENMLNMTSARIVLAEVKYLRTQLQAISEMSRESLHDRSGTTAPTRVS